MDFLRPLFLMRRSSYLSPFYTIVCEISARSALPQALAYMMSNPTMNQPIFGVLTNGNDGLFVKLSSQPTPQYDLSRAFSIYTVASEVRSTFQVFKHLGQIVARST